MPLIKVPKGASKKKKNSIIGQNIRELQKSGKSHERAVEIAGAAGNSKSRPKPSNISRSKIRKTIKAVKRLRK